MPWIEINPAGLICHRVQRLCARPYPDHPHGCPNYGRKVGCPPLTPLLSDLYDMGGPFYAVYSAFDLGAHAMRMLDIHPEWSMRQARCCLYWQGGARKNLKGEIARFRWAFADRQWKVDSCPEARGVNISRVLLNAGLRLEWPVRTLAHQVALAGLPRKNRYV